MQLTRKFLASKGLEANVIDEIIEAHTGDVNFIKDALDEAKKYEADAKRYEAANAELKELKAKFSESKLKDYDKLKQEFEDYKLEVNSKVEKDAKEMAFKELLTDLGIPDKHLQKIVKYSDVDGIKLDDAGKITDSSELIKTVKEDWGDFIETKGKEKSNPSNPPGNTGGKALSKDEILKIKDTTERQNAWRAYLEEEGEI